MKVLRILGVLMITVFIAVWILANRKETAEPAPPILATPTPQLPSNADSVATIPQPVEHLIGVRVVDGVGEFFARDTGEKFVPRGMNYIRLGGQILWDGSSNFGYNMFDPGKYNAPKIDLDLNIMNMRGYNTVRVFISPDMVGTQSGGLSFAYMRNVADFLQRAKKNHIHVMFTLDRIPDGKYGEILLEDCCTIFALLNSNFLPPAGLKANQTFFKDFITDLLSLNAPTEYIFSYELRNELAFDSDQAPFTMTSGLVRTANGKMYDMADPTNRDLMMKENLVYWINEMRKAIREVDPTALVSAGFSVPQGPNPARPGDPKISITEPAIWSSDADFVDLHAFVGIDLTIHQYAENFGIKDMKTKPVIMGEFGAEVALMDTAQAAALRFREWQAESCAYGFDGWLFWTWDTNEQPELFNAMMDAGIINKTLAPEAMPDPCVP